MLPDFISKLLKLYEDVRLKILYIFQFDLEDISYEVPLTFGPTVETDCLS